MKLKDEEKMKIPESIKVLIDAGLWDEVCTESRRQSRNIQRLIRTHQDSSPSYIIYSFLTWSFSIKLYGYWKDKYEQLNEDT